jgi:hypothetical protein
MGRAYLKSRSWNYVKNLNKKYLGLVDDLKSEEKFTSFSHITGNLLQILSDLEEDLKYKPVWDRKENRQEYFVSFLELKDYLRRIEEDSEFRDAELNTEEGYQ